MEHSRYKKGYFRKFTRLTNLEEAKERWRHEGILVNLKITNLEEVKKRGRDVGPTSTSESKESM